MYEYQPYQPQMNPMQFAMQQMQQFQQRGQQTQPAQSLIRVTGIDGAKAYQMPPNSVVPLFDADNDIMYVKSTDGAGFPTIRTFAFTPVDTPQPEAQQQSFVTHDELRRAYEELKGMIQNVQQPVQQPELTEQQ